MSEPKQVHPERREAHVETIELLGKSAVPILLELDPLHAMLLIGIMQLTLRHPLLNKDSKAYARRLVDQLGDALATIAPGVQDIIALGWDPAHDE